MPKLKKIGERFQKQQERYNKFLRIAQHCSKAKYAAPCKPKQVYRICYFKTTFIPRNGFVSVTQTAVGAFTNVDQPTALVDKNATRSPSQVSELWIDGKMSFWKKNLRFFKHFLFGL